MGRVGGGINLFFVIVTTERILVGEIQGVSGSIVILGSGDKEDVQGIGLLLLLLFDFKSRAKEKPDLKSATKAINAIVGNYCGYTIKAIKSELSPKKQQDKGASEPPPYRPKTDNDIQELLDSIIIQLNVLTRQILL